MAVIFAMLASYLLSRTVVPTMVSFLLPELLAEIDTSLAQMFKDLTSSEEKVANRSRDYATAPRLNGLGQILGFLSSIHENFNHLFERLRARYCQRASTGPWSIGCLVLVAMAGSLPGSLGLFPLSGSRLLPPGSTQDKSDCMSGRPAGTRLESKGTDLTRSGTRIREVIPANAIERRPRQHRPAGKTESDLAFIDNSTDQLTRWRDSCRALNPKHQADGVIQRSLRAKLPREFPDRSSSSRRRIS